MRAKHLLDLISAAARTDTLPGRLALAAGWNLDEEITRHREWRKNQKGNLFTPSKCPECGIKPKQPGRGYCLECGRARSLAYYYREKKARTASWLSAEQKVCLTSCKSTGY